MKTPKVIIKKKKQLSIFSVPGGGGDAVCV